jgi:predicted secreted protein
VVDEHDTDDATGDVERDEPTTLAQAHERIAELRKSLSQVRKEAGNRRHELRELQRQQTGDQGWRELALSSLVTAEAAAAGATKPELVSRLVDLGEINGDASLDEIRAAVREQVTETLEDNPELRAPQRPLVSQGVRSRGYTGERPQDPDAWLRRAARSRQ